MNSPQLAQRTRVLLVEDNDVEAKTIERVMLFDGVELERATTLAEMETRLEQGGIDVVLLDLGLPDSVGSATASAILKRCADVPIIVLTGYDDAATAQSLLVAGAQEYIVKGREHDNPLHRGIRHSIHRHGVFKELLRAVAQAENLSHKLRALLEEAGSLITSQEQTNDARAPKTSPSLVARIRELLEENALETV